MATFKMNEGFSYAAAASIDLTNKQNHIAKILADGSISLCGAGELPLGVIYEGAAAGYPATVYWGSIGKVKLGVGGIIAGQKLMCDANGQAVLATTGNYSFGMALTSGNVNEVVTFAFIPGGKA